MLSCICFGRSYLSQVNRRGIKMASSVSFPLLSRVVAASINVANTAGKIIRDTMTKGDLGIVEKGINDLQTEADRAAQRCIVGALSGQFPKVTIIGEETLEPKDDEPIWHVEYDKQALNQSLPDHLTKIKEEEVVIWVDPLDGTSEYTQGLLDHVTILIGIAVNGKAIGGVINQPYYNYKNVSDVNNLGRTMWGILGVGVQGIDQKLPSEGERIITTTRSHSNKLINSTLEMLKPDSILRVGGAGHKIILLIEGKAHAYVFPSSGCKKWDTCAPEAILHALGGKLTDIKGNDLHYHKTVEHINASGVLATFSTALHQQICSEIPDEVKEQL